jgi:hypothetical protein
MWSLCLICSWLCSLYDNDTVAVCCNTAVNHWLFDLQLSMTKKTDNTSDDMDGDNATSQMANSPQVGCRRRRWSCVSNESSPS